MARRRVLTAAQLGPQRRLCWLAGTVLLFCLLCGAGRVQAVELLYAWNMAEIAKLENVTALARLHSLVQQKRLKKSGDLIFIHGGSSLAPAILSSIDKGSHMISLLNLLRPDLMTISRSDFTHGEDELTLRAREASFPLVASNTHDPLMGGNIENIAGNQLLLADSATPIGIISLVDPECIIDYMPKRVRCIDSDQAVEAQSSQLTEKGAELLVLLTDYRLTSGPVLLEKGLVDLVMMRTPNNGPVKLLTRSSTLSIQPAKNNPILLDLVPENRSSPLKRAELVDLSRFPASPQVTAQLTGTLSSLRAILAGVIGRTALAMDTRRISVRTAENGFANFIADVIRNFYQADISLINGGCIRGNRQYPANSELTRGDIWQELPFNNRIVRIKISGRHLLAALENGLSRVEDLKGRFPHISGMQVSWDPQRIPGNRVLSVKVHGRPLEMNRSYLLATTDYLASGGDGYESLVRGEKLVKEGGGLPLWEYVKNEINRQRIIFPRVEGRMKAVSND